MPGLVYVELVVTWVMMYGERGPCSAGCIWSERPLRAVGLRGDAQVWQLAYMEGSCGPGVYTEFDWCVVVSVYGAWPW